MCQLLEEGKPQLNENVRFLLMLIVNLLCWLQFKPEVTLPAKFDLQNLCVLLFCFVLFGAFL